MPHVIFIVFIWQFLELQPLLLQEALLSLALHR